MANGFLGTKVALACAVLTGIAACGGGGGGGGGAIFPFATGPAPTVSDTTTPGSTDRDLTIKVMEGSIRNAQVFLDRNNNGMLDSGEPSGRTDASGSVTLKVASDDLGSGPVVALVGTDAVDTLFGPVTTAYILKAPADRPQRITSFTTLIHRMVENTGASSDQAEANVRSQLGLPANLFTDYSADNASVAAAAMLVRFAQRISDVLAPAIDQPTLSGGPITATDIANESQNMLLDRLLPIRSNLDSRYGRESCATGANSEQCKANIAHLADLYVTDSNENQLTVSNVGLAVMATRNLTTAPNALEEAPGPAGTLDFLTLTNSTNWSRRLFLSTAEELTPVNGIFKYRELRNNNVNGTIAAWSSGNSPERQNDLHWSGTAWVSCPAGFQNTSTVRDARSVNIGNYCDGLSISVNRRMSVDISGQPLAAVFMGVKAHPYSTNGPYGQRYSTWGPNMGAVEMLTSLAPYTFPAGSVMYYQNAVDLEAAPIYTPTDANKATVSLAEVAAGGDSRVNPAVACSVSTAAFTPATSLEDVISRNPGKPCINAPANLAGTAFSSGPRNDGWQGTSLSLLTLGGAPLGTAATATDYYTTNTPIRVSFAGGGSTAVTFYECKQRAINGSARNCDVVGEGSYTITQLGDARVMRFSRVPGLATYSGSERVLVERNGEVYLANQSKSVARKQIRMNLTAANAIFSAFTGLGYVGLTQIAP